MGVSRRAIPECWYFSGISWGRGALFHAYAHAFASQYDKCYTGATANPQARFHDDHSKAGRACRPNQPLTCRRPHGQDIQRRV